MRLYLKSAQFTIIKLVPLNAASSARQPQNLFHGALVKFMLSIVFVWFLDVFIGLISRYSHVASVQKVYHKMRVGFRTRFMR